MYRRNTQTITADDLKFGDMPTYEQRRETLWNLVKWRRGSRDAQARAAGMSSSSARLYRKAWHWVHERYGEAAYAMPQIECMRLYRESNNKV